MEDLVSHLDDKLCIDKEQMVLSGASNGGMFVYHFMGQRPKLFKGIILEYGQPLIGYFNTPKELEDIHFLSLHGRQDVTIPLSGGVDGNNEWIYESVDSIVNELATV